MKAPSFKPAHTTLLHPGRVSSRLLILVFGVVAVALIVGGFWFYSSQVELIRENRFGELQFIAELKRSQILQWREERLSDIELSAQDPVIVENIDALLRAPADPQLGALFLTKMSLVVKYENYHSMFLTTPDGKILLDVAAHIDALEPETRDLVSRTAFNRSPQLGDFIRSKTEDKIFVDVAAPILDLSGTVAAVLILRTDPEEYLYPLVQTWPARSRSGETLLVRRDGDSVLFLNRLRHREDPPLSVRLPLTQTDSPSVMAVTQTDGPVSGPDYRGSYVLAQIMEIPGTSWHMVTKIDREEVLADTRQVGWVTVTIVALAILMTMAFAAYLINIQQRMLLQMLFQAELERRVSKEETRVTLYSIGDGVITTGRDGRITRMNPAAELLTGWRETDAVGLPSTDVFKLLHEHTRTPAADPIQGVLERGQIVSLDEGCLLAAKVGSLRAIADSAAPIRDSEGGVIGVVLVFRDQTEERRAHQALLDSEERFTRAFTANPTAMTISRMAGDVILDANQRFLQMIGCARAELIGKSALDSGIFCAPAERGAILERLGASGQAATGELSIQGRGGETLRVLYSVDKIQLGNEDCLLSTFSDITQQKRVEEELRRSQAALNKAQAVARVGSWLWTMRDMRLAWSDEMYAIFGVAPDDFHGTAPEIIAERIHPEDRAAVEDWNVRLLNLERPGPLEYRLVMPDGSIRWMWGEMGEYAFDKTGALSEITGVVQDISERRQVDQDLLLSQARYRNLVELSPDAIFINRGNRIDFINPAALILFGASEPAQILGRSPFELFHPDYHDAISERIEHMEDHPGAVPVMQERIVRLDGSVRDVEVVASSVNDASGPAIQVILRDITERMQAERQLNDQLYELRRWYAATLGREKRVIELKAEVNQLLAHMGQMPRYPSVQKMDLK